MTQVPSLIYAELLSNIRQISVLAALETPCDATTKVQLSDDGQSFLLLHRGLSHSLQLPGQSASNFQLQKPAIGSKDFSWRLPWVRNISDEVTTITPSTRAHSGIENISDDVPWSANFMRNFSELSCRICYQNVLEKGRIETWKDLPSDDWAEMMDLWHCHRPDNKIEETCDSSNQHHNDHNSCRDQVTSQLDMTKRAYGAKSQIAAQQGVGFIDITTFLIAKEDCTNIQVEKVKKNLLTFTSF